MTAIRRHIRLTFTATGESISADLLDDEAPRTCEMIRNRLPLEHDLVHGRYSGMEVFGEILYWYTQGTSVTGDGNPVAEICLIYGRGVTLRGPEGTPSHGTLFAHSRRLEIRLARVPTAVPRRPHVPDPPADRTSRDWRRRRATPEVVT